MITATEVELESYRTGENIHDARRRLEIGASPNASKSVLKARERLEAAEADFENAVQFESDKEISVRVMGDRINNVEIRVRNTRELLGQANAVVAVFEADFSSWFDVCNNSPVGLARALDASFENRRNMEDRIKFLTPDLEQQLKELEGLKAELAKVKGDGRK